MAMPQDSSQEASPSAGRRILLVEDDAAFRALLVRKLRRCRHEVTEAASAEDAIFAVASDQGKSGRASYDVVVSDVRMHGMSGLHLLATLRSHDPSLPIVLMTAFSDAATHAEASRLGATMLSKPFDLDELSRVVQHAERGGARRP